MLSKDRIKELNTPRERTLDVPLLGESVRVNLFRKGDIDAMRAESLTAGEVDNTKFERLLMMRGLIEPAFTDEEYEELRGGSAAVYYALLNTVMEGNGLTQMAQRDARRTFSAAS